MSHNFLFIVNLPKLIRISYIRKSINDPLSFKCSIFTFCSCSWPPQPYQPLLPVFWTIGFWLCLESNPWYRRLTCMSLLSTFSLSSPICIHRCKLLHAPLRLLKELGNCKILTPDIPCCLLLQCMKHRRNPCDWLAMEPWIWSKALRRLFIDKETFLQCNLHQASVSFLQCQETWRLLQEGSEQQPLLWKPSSCQFPFWRPHKACHQFSPSLDCWRDL